MGCFNVSGCISQLPILYGQDVVCFIGCYNIENDDLPCVFWPMEFIAPFTLPIYGKYNDYGGIEEVEKNAHTEVIEHFFNCDVETVLNTISRLNNGYIRGTINYWANCESELLQKFADETKVLLPLIEKIGRCYKQESYRFTLLFEHKEVWGKIISEAKQKETIRHKNYFELISKIKTAANSLSDKSDRKDLNICFPSFFETVCFEHGFLSLLNLADEVKSFKSIKKLLEENKLDRAFFPNMGNDYFMKLFSSVSLEDKFTLYENCKNDIIDFYNVFYFLESIPIRLNFSMTCQQQFSFKNHQKLTNIISRLTEKLIEEREEE